MGTNENVNNINENILGQNELASKANIENTGGATDNTIVVDVQEIQKIATLGKLTEKQDEIPIKNQIGCIVSKNDTVINKDKDVASSTNEDKINILGQSSEISTEQIAQKENSLKNDLFNENVQKTPNETIKQVNIKDTQTKHEDSDEKSNLQDKEKQHAQDKKDYRLEKMLFDRINKMQGKIKESLELIQKFERMNSKQESLPNIVTTLHDKLTHEVIKQFRTVGIEFNMRSYLVQSVVSDLLSKFEEGITEFRDCSENLNFVREVQEDFESKVEIAPTSKVKNFFARLRGIFKPEKKQEKLEELERERQEKKLEEANVHLVKYKAINNELESYTIKNNIVNSLSREVLYGQGSGLTLSVSDFINEKIVPEMQKFGLEDLIPNLEQKLYEKYREKDEEISNEEFKNTQVGELRKNMKLPKMNIIKSKINTVISVNGTMTEDDEKMAV